jgi:hypothetical protein
LVPTPFNPTDFLKASLSYLAPVLIFETTSTTLPNGTTGTTPAALEVRPNGDIITDGDRLHTCSKRMHGHGKLVAQHTWVPKKRLTTCVRVQVGSTNAHSAHPYLDPSRRWCIRHGDITQPQICDIVEADLEHAGLFSTGVGVGG